MDPLALGVQKSKIRGNTMISRMVANMTPIPNMTKSTGSKVRPNIGTPKNCAISVKEAAPNTKILLPIQDFNRGNLIRHDKK